MALFPGEELVDVQTPDGRTLKVPKSIVPAAMLPQQISTLPGAVESAPATTAVQPPETPDPAVAADALGAMAAPIGNAVQDAGSAIGEAAAKPEPMMADMIDRAPTIAQTAAAAKKAKADAAYAATPQGQMAAAQQGQMAAGNAERDAILGQSVVQQAEQDTVADALKDRNTTLNGLYADRQKVMQDEQIAQDKKMAEIEGMRKKIAGTKINREADHPILAAIMAALAGLGSAMSKPFNQGPVNTLDILYKAIDRKVAAQEADLDQMGKVYGMTKEELAMLKERAKNKLEFHNTLIAGETEKAIRQVEELTARSSSAKTKADAAFAIAQLQQRMNDKTMEAMRWGLDYDQKDRHQKQQIALGWGGIAEQRYATNVNAQLRREEIAKDMEIALANTKSTGDAAAYKAQLEMGKEARQMGVRDMNGDFLLTPDGKAKMAEAQKYEDQAKALESNPDVMARSIASDKIALLRQKAAVLRGDAQTQDVVKAHSDTEAVSVSNMVSSGQSVVQLIDGIKQLSDEAGRGLIKRSDAQVKLKAMFEQLKPGLKEAWLLGAWDKGADYLTKGIIGLDPSSDWDAGVLAMGLSQKMYESPGAFKQGLDSVAEDLERKAKNKLVNLGAKFGKDERVLQRTETPDVSPTAVKLTQERTPVEQENAANAKNDGLIAGGAHQLAYHLNKGLVDASAPSSPSDEAARAANSGSLKYIGLSQKQEPLFEERLQAYKRGDKKAGDELIGMVAETAAKRPELAVPLLQNIQQFAQPLYSAARAAVPKDSPTDQIMTQSESNKVGAAVTPTDMLADNVVRSIDESGKVVDNTGFAELATRATDVKDASGKVIRHGDPAAKRAILEIVKISGQNRQLPVGSVFREGR